MSRKRLMLGCFILIAVLCSSAESWTDELQGNCQWIGSSAEWVLSRRPPQGAISGSLGYDLVPHLHRNGIPISFISSPRGDAAVQLKFDGTITMEELLKEILRQQPEYRYGAFAGRIVIYPAGEEYRKPVEVNSLPRAKRAKAMYALLKELKAEFKAFHELQLPWLRGPGGRSLYGDSVEIGGSRSVVEHLVSLMGSRPSIAFRVLAKEDYLGFALDSVPLVKEIAVRAETTVDVGAVIGLEVTGTTLSGGTRISLKGPECGVEYVVDGGGALEIDDSGRIVARQPGTGTIVVRYEDQVAQAEVHVQ